MEPGLIDTRSTVAPASCAARMGSVSSTCSTPSVARTAMCFPESSLATGITPLEWLLPVRRKGLRAPVTRRQRRDETWLQGHEFSSPDRAQCDSADGTYTSSRSREYGMFKEFREFLFRGNVIDLAVAVVIGTA